MGDQQQRAGLAEPPRIHVPDEVVLRGWVEGARAWRVLGGRAGERMRRWARPGGQQGAGAKVTSHMPASHPTARPPT